MCAELCEYLFFRNWFIIRVQWWFIWAAVLQPGDALNRQNSLCHVTPLARGEVGGVKKAKEKRNSTEGFFFSRCCIQLRPPAVLRPRPLGSRLPCRYWSGGAGLLELARTVRTRTARLAAAQTTAEGTRVVLLSRKYALFAELTFLPIWPGAFCTHNVGTLRQWPPWRDFIRLWRYVDCNIGLLYCWSGCVAAAADLLPPKKEKWCVHQGSKQWPEMAFLSVQQLACKLKYSRSKHPHSQ